jgi:hypothetical protein
MYRPMYPEAAKVSPFMRDFLQEEVPDPVPASRAYEQLASLIHNALVNEDADTLIEFAEKIATRVWVEALGDPGHLPAPHWPEDGSGDEFDGGYDPTSTMTAVE